jgi:5-methylcytosine-specific restriction protein A
VSPSKPRRPCKAPGCPGLTSGKYCQLHVHLEQQDRRRWDLHRGNKVERGYGGSWERARGMKLRQDPLCFDCGRPAELVHHLRAIADGGERLDFENMVSLCVPCHGKRHGARKEVNDFK